VLLCAGAIVHGLAYAGAILAAGVLDASEWSIIRGLARRARAPARRDVPC
jgi:hypothetical protein